MSKLKIISFKAKEKIIIPGNFINLSWNVKNHFFIILKIGKRFKLFYKRNNTKIFIYQNQKIKLIAFGDFETKTKEINVKVKSTYVRKKSVKILLRKFSIKDYLTKPKIFSNVKIINTKFKIKNIQIPNYYEDK
tara:strand:+ start:33 stop:434 length:402 start_codon:yes stop_codon:yes gene_type:complete